MTINTFCKFNNNTQKKVHKAKAFPAPVYNF